MCIRDRYKRGRKHNNVAMSVEISISCVVKGHHHCPSKVKEGEVFSVSKKRGDRSFCERCQPGHLQAEFFNPLWCGFLKDFSDIFSYENFDKCTKQN